jgi:hypothetical protein
VSDYPYQLDSSLHASLGLRGRPYKIYRFHAAQLNLACAGSENCQAVEVAADAVLQSWSLQIPTNDNKELTE